MSVFIRSTFDFLSMLSREGGGQFGTPVPKERFFTYNLTDITISFRVACPKFGHPALGSGFQNHALKHRVSGYCRHVRKELNYHSKAENNLKTDSPSTNIANYFSRAKSRFLLDRQMSKLWTGCTNLGQSPLLFLSDIVLL